MFARRRVQEVAPQDFQSGRWARSADRGLRELSTDRSPWNIAGSIPEGRCVKKSKYSRLINALKRELLAPPLLDDPPFAARRPCAGVGIAKTNRSRRPYGCSVTSVRDSKLAAGG